MECTQNVAEWFKRINEKNRYKFKEKIYYSISKTPFKLRYANHTKSFNMERYKNLTKLTFERGMENKRGEPYTYS